MSMNANFPHSSREFLNLSFVNGSGHFVALREQLVVQNFLASQEQGVLTEVHL